MRKASIYYMNLKMCHHFGFENCIVMEFADDSAQCHEHHPATCMSSSCSSSEMMSNNNFGFLFAFKNYQNPKSQSYHYHPHDDSHQNTKELSTDVIVNSLENFVHSVTHSDIIHVEIIPVVGGGRPTPSPFVLHSEYHKNNNKDDKHTDEDDEIMLHYSRIMSTADFEHDDVNVQEFQSMVLKISPTAYSAYVGLGFNEHDSSFCITDATYKLVYVPMSYHQMMIGVDFLHSQRGKQYNYLALPLTILPSWCKRRKLQSQSTAVKIGASHTNKNHHDGNHHCIPSHQDEYLYPSQSLTHYHCDPDNNSYLHHDYCHHYESVHKGIHDFDHPNDGFFASDNYEEDDYHDPSTMQATAVYPHHEHSSDINILPTSVHQTLQNPSKVFCSQLGLTLCYLCGVFSPPEDHGEHLNKKYTHFQYDHYDDYGPKTFMDPMCCTPCELYNLLMPSVNEHDTKKIAMEWPKTNIAIHSARAEVF